MAACADGPGADRARRTFEGLQGAPIEEPGITRDDLGRTLPASAAGQELGLWHYTIPAGAELPPHTHPGPQIARVITGDLEYTVIAGEGTVVSMDGTSTPIGPGTYVLHAGDTIIENPGLEHYGANRGPGVVELIAATLYPEGAPLSTPLELAEPRPLRSARSRSRARLADGDASGRRPAQIPTSAIAAASVQSSIAPVMSGARPIATVAIAARMSPARVALPTLTSPRVLGRLAHVHVDDDAQVVERGRRGVEHHQDGEQRSASRRPGARRAR